MFSIKGDVTTQCPEKDTHSSSKDASIYRAPCDDCSDGRHRPRPPNTIGRPTTMGWAPRDRTRMAPV
ncbi:hypothetical protein DPMN_118611 [Dreissena polymorpha]|uniref:Uncharacterized protein n=1 Tax=Dreissena polymorpha TaxID=45954 RepID=A0A9D4GNE8_DREPO|nr:hypothetical protein DPMN_118611 [Dreissena polymorpha]